MFSFHRQEHDCHVKHADSDITFKKIASTFHDLDAEIGPAEMKTAQCFLQKQGPRSLSGADFRHAPYILSISQKSMSISSKLR